MKKEQNPSNNHGEITFKRRGCMHVVTITIGGKKITCAVADFPNGGRGGPVIVGTYKLRLISSE